MPGHFLVKIEGETPAQFVDCFNGGTILREEDCEQFITASGINLRPKIPGEDLNPDHLSAHAQKSVEYL